MFYERKTPPTEQLKRDGQHMSFRVWANAPYYQEDPQPWKCVAMFRYLLECLDYIAHCQDEGCDVVFESPGETKLIRATDRRTVYKPDSPASIVA